jgi:hypothetical protein
MIKVICRCNNKEMVQNQWEQDQDEILVGFDCLECEASFYGTLKLGSFQPLATMTEHKIGERLIQLLNLPVKENGRVDTGIGDKTPLGLARTVQRIFDEGR